MGVEKEATLGVVSTNIDRGRRFASLLREVACVCSRDRAAAAKACGEPHSPEPEARHAFSGSTTSC